MNIRLAGSRLALATLLAIAWLPGCAQRAAKPGPPASPAAVPPALLLGDFQDDYGARFTITPTDFFQRSRNHFRIVRWNTDSQFLIAQNDSLNPSDPGKWTRIDWMKLNGMAPFEWAFCFTAYRADSREAAESTPPANRDTPLTGCNRFPFSRMKRSN